MTQGKSENGVMSITSLRREIAQMVMPRIDGHRLSDPAYRDGIETLVREGIGGFILFGGDIEQTQRHLEALQAISEIPLLIASDVERGLGQQLAGGTSFPSQRAVASAINRRSKKDAELLDAMLDAVRRETRAAGIHAVFSPVVDVNNNPANPIICTRSFGDDPEIVEWFGSRYIKGLQRSDRRGKADLLACAKHFPGHGDTDQDSHSVLPEIRANKQRLNRVELPPFREAVKVGVGMVMVAHLSVPALDPDAPTTFSKKIVTALLREGMGFEGLIVSDALDMGALDGRYHGDEIAVRTVDAGMDILLHPRNVRETIDAVVAAVEQGKLTRERIAESVERIREAKQKLGLFDKNGHERVAVDYERHRVTADEIGSQAIRILPKSIRDILPLNPEGGVACFILDDDGDHESSKFFMREMKERFQHVSLLVLTPADGIPISLVNDCIKASGAVVIAVYSRISASKGRSGISKRLRQMADDILRTSAAAHAKVIVLSFDSPYILDQFSEVDVRIAAFDRMAGIQKAAAVMLAGKQ